MYYSLEPTTSEYAVRAAHVLGPAGWDPITDENKEEADHVDLVPERGGVAAGVGCLVCLGLLRRAFWTIRALPPKASPTAREVQQAG